MKINCSKWPYTSFVIPAYQKIVIAKKADFHARRTSRSAHDRLANILRTHAVWTSGERNAIMARGRLYNRNFGPRATITLRARSLMFYNRLSWTFNHTSQATCYALSKWQEHYQMHLRTIGSTINLQDKRKS